MKLFGVKLVPILVAALAAYIVGMVIYGLLFSAQWMAWSGKTAESFKGLEWRMALSPIMPLVLSFGIAKAINARNIVNWISGLKLGVFIGLFLTISTRLYTFVYGTEPIELYLLDSVHFILISAVCGAILAKMKVGEV